MGRPKIDLTGQVFGELTAIRPVGTKFKNIIWLCVCSCGKEVEVTSGKLRDSFRHTKSCGCVGREKSKKRLTTHGYTKTGTRQISEYGAWHSIKDRCLNKNNHAFKNYGGRGITICERWLNSFENFINDMGYKPTPLHTLDRKDNEKGYSPDNCRWATWDIQNKNRRNNKWIECRGKRMIAEDWARLIGVPASNMLFVLKARVKKGLGMEQVLQHYEKKSGGIIL